MRIKELPLFLALTYSVVLFAQQATEIYLFDLQQEEDSYILSNPINISKQEGYDNQPSFTEDGLAILFSSFRNNQADIARYDLEGDYRTWVTNTPEFSEHSPAPFPNKKKYFTCIRFSQDEKQTLYKYSYKNKVPEILIPNINIAYYTWINKNSIATYTIGEVDVLQVSNFRFKIKYPIQENIGRSLNKIPFAFAGDQELISFINKNHETPELYFINPQTSESKYIIDPIEGAEDLTWTKDGSILMGKGSEIFKFKPGQDKTWQPTVIESKLPIQNISRMAVSPDGKKIAVVVSE